MNSSIILFDILLSYSFISETLPSGVNIILASGKSKSIAPLLFLLSINIFAKTSAVLNSSTTWEYLAFNSSSSFSSMSDTSV